MEEKSLEVAARASSVLIELEAKPPDTLMVYIAGCRRIS